MIKTNDFSPQWWEIEGKNVTQPEQTVRPRDKRIPGWQWRPILKNVFLFLFSECAFCPCSGFKGSSYGSPCPPMYRMKTSLGGQSLTAPFVRQRWVNVCQKTVGIHLVWFLDCVLMHYRRHHRTHCLRSEKVFQHGQILEQKDVVKSLSSDCPPNGFSRLLPGSGLAETLYVLKLDFNLW